MDPLAGIRIGVFEDELLVRESFEESLRLRKHQVFGAGNVTDFLTLVQQGPPQIAIVNLTLLASTSESGEASWLAGGWGAIHELRDWFGDTKIVVLSRDLTSDVAQRADHEGVSALLGRRSTSLEFLADTVRAVERGERRFELALAEGLSRSLAPMPGPDTMRELVSITHREREVLRLLAGGADNLKIAAMLGITERTVRAHVSNLYRKIGSENRTQLALAARRMGLRPPS